VNRVLFLESVAAMFVTIFYGILNMRTGEVAYCNGGHNPPYLLRGDGRVEAMEPTGGLVLGAMKNTAYTAGKLVLQSGDGIFLYTDGVTEAMDGRNEQFSEIRLEASLQQAPSATLPEIIHGVVTAVKNFSNRAPQADDITVLALRFSGPG
jgi:sigma-B regulation protein RsbU (phosphoserine phosphatase)